MKNGFCSLAMLSVTMMLFAGCGQAAKVSPDKAKTTTVSEKDEAGHSHEGWWCSEHGVPEGECGLCNSKLAAAFQKKGDWCQEHDRPDSQCFKCHPELEAKFAAQYEAKYGKAPPKPTEG
jgi:hypothetical protein